MLTPAPTVHGVLGEIGRHPVRTTVRYWNWKSALLSTVVRGLLFFQINLVAGFGPALGAMVTEMVYRASVTGFLGGLTQAFRKVEPAWKGTLAVLVILPLTSHIMEFAVHWIRGTPELFLSIGASMVFSMISSLYNYFVMRRGVFIVGEGSRSLGSDMAALPGVTLAFLTLPVRLLLSRRPSGQEEGDGGPERAYRETETQKPIKTFHLTNTFHDASGGIRMFYLNMLEAANRERRYVRLLVPGRETRTEDVGDYGRIYHVRAPHIPLFDRRYRHILPHRFLNPRDASIWPILRAEQPDLIEISDKYSLSYISTLLRAGWISIHPKNGRRPTVVAMSCERMDDNIAAFLTTGQLGQALARTYMRFVYGRQFDAFLANSPYTAQEIVETAPAEKQQRIYALPRGVDVECFRPDRRGTSRPDILRAADAGETSVILLYVGRLSPEKNLPLLIQVMSRLVAETTVDYRLLLAGDGPLRSSLEGEAAVVAPGRTSFLGHVGSRDDLANLYASADVFVHPNPKEPFGIAPLEAIASGTPVVAPRSGGILSYLDDDNAWLTKPTSEAFAAEIQAITKDDDERARRCANARRTAEGRSWERVTQMWFDLYDQVHRQRLLREARDRDPDKPHANRRIA